MNLRSKRQAKRKDKSIVSMKEKFMRSVKYPKSEFVQKQLEEEMNKWKQVYDEDFDLSIFDYLLVKDEIDQGAQEGVILDEVKELDPVVEDEKEMPTMALNEPLVDIVVEDVTEESTEVVMSIEEEVEIEQVEIDDINDESVENEEVKEEKSTDEVVEVVEVVKEKKARATKKKGRSKKTK